MVSLPLLQKALPPFFALQSQYKFHVEYQPLLIVLKIYLYAPSPHLASDSLQHWHSMHYLLSGFPLKSSRTTSFSHLPNLKTFSRARLAEWLYFYVTISSAPLYFHTDGHFPRWDRLFLQDAWESTRKHYYSPTSSRSYCCIFLSAI